MFGYDEPECESQCIMVYMKNDVLPNVKLFKRRFNPRKIINEA